MKIWALLAAMNLVVLFSKAQPEKELVLLNVKNDRLELAKAIKFLNASNPKLICVNFDLSNCDDTNHLPSNHFDNETTTILPSESEKKLSQELAASSSILMPSGLYPFGSNEIIEVIGCSFLYPDNVPTGFINLIYNDKILNQIEKFKISNEYEHEVSYHFAVKIAFQLAPSHSFIKSVPNILPVNLKRDRKFNTHSIEHFYSDKESVKTLQGKIIILGVDKPDEYRLVPTSTGIKKMTTS